VKDAVVAWTDGVLSYVGAADGYTGSEPRSIDSTVVPGFVDSHTHLPFYGWRADEFAARLAGKSYKDLHGEGGIYRSARMFDEATDEQVLGFCRPLLAEMLAHGTTTVELKTGYGLSVETELRQARLARQLADEALQTCTVTLLACHAVPEGVAKDAWVEIACTELIPAAAEEHLVDAVDIFVEDIAFDLHDLDRVADAAHHFDLPLRCHVEQLTNLHGAAAAVALGARSVDHLNHLDQAAVDAIAVSEAIAGLLPASTLVLGSTPPPARGLIEAGAAVVIATDFNPGTSPVLSMPEVVSLACILYGLTPEEAFVAATANAACALGLGHELGTLEVGKRADLVVLEAGIAAVPYRSGHNPVVQTYVAGEAVPLS
jgi:imidazolonepropionase